MSVDSILSVGQERTVFVYVTEFVHSKVFNCADGGAVRSIWDCVCVLWGVVRGRIGGLGVCLGRVYAGCG